jgi:hypothetical protein
MEASTILVDLQSFLTRAISISKSTAADETKARERTVGVLRSLLQVLLTPGLNPDIDAICRDQLGLLTRASVGFHKFAFVNTGIHSDILQACRTALIRAYQQTYGCHFQRLRWEADFKRGWKYYPDKYPEIHHDHAVLAGASWVDRLSSITPTLPGSHN